jgi:hypothetical protein
MPRRNVKGERSMQISPMIEARVCPLAARDAMVGSRR